MTERRTRDEWLGEAIEAATKCRDWSAGHTLDTYRTEDILRSALERQVDLFSEAVRSAERVDPRLADALPDIQDIKAIHSHLYHRYFAIDDALTWHAITVTMPVARRRIIRFMRETV